MLHAKIIDLKKEKIEVKKAEDFISSSKFGASLIFKGNEYYKKIIEKSAFCSEDNNIIPENYKIIKDQKIGIIPPIGGG